jgi:hypothetical protein
MKWYIPGILLVESGVPQGSVLGPSLFLFYINDMPDGIQSTVRLFADNTIAYVTISSDADAANLQQDFDKLAEWESKWLMKFHILEHDTSAKYLGCTISSDLKWGIHINTICSKANNTISFLKRNINISNKSIKEKVYVSLVRPTLEYASSVWDPYQQNDIHRWRWFKEGLHDMLLIDTTTSSVSSMIEQLEWTTGFRADGGYMFTPFEV